MVYYLIWWFIITFIEIFVNVSGSSSTREKNTTEKINLTFKVSVIIDREWREREIATTVEP